MYSDKSKGLSFTYGKPCNLKFGILVYDLLKTVELILN